MRHRFSRSLLALAVLIPMGLFYSPAGSAAPAPASPDNLEVRTFDEEPLGEPPAECDVGGDVVVAEAPFGEAPADNRAARLVDDNSSLTTTMVCDYPSSDERYVSFGFSPQRYGAYFLFGVRGDTADGGSGNAWWFGLAPSPAGDVFVDVYDGSSWQRLGAVEEFPGAEAFVPVTLSATAGVAEITVGSTSYVTDLRRDETINFTDVVFSSAGRGSVGIEFYVDDLAVGSELSENPAGVQFEDAVKWVAPVTDGDTSPEFRLVSFRSIGGPPEETFEATVDWGAGPEPAGVVAGGDEGDFDVRASHPYREPGNENVVVAVTGSAGTSGRVSLNLRVEDRAVVAVEPEGLAPRFPSVIRLHDGRLLTAYYSGSGHVDPQGEIRLTESNDDGRTWSEPRTVVSGEFDNRDPKLTQLADGTILIAYFITNWSDPGDRKQLGTHVVRSEDGGATWSDPIWVDTRMSCAQPPPPGGCSAPDGWSASHGSVVELANGDLLAPLYGVVPGTGSGDVGVNVYDGSSWNRLGKVEDFAAGGSGSVTVDVTAGGAEITVGDQSFSTDLNRDETVNLNDVIFSSAGRGPTGMEFYVDDLAVAPEVPAPADTEVRTFDGEPAGEPPDGCTAQGDITVTEDPAGDGTDDQAVRLVDDVSTLATTMLCGYPSSSERHLSFELAPERFGNWFLFGIRGDTAAGSPGNAWWFALSSESADPRQRATVARSTDGGRTWNLDQEVTIAANEQFHYQEPNLTLLPSGEIIAGIRTTSSPQVIYLSRSSDNGHTWTEPQRTDIPGSSHHQLLRDDGSVLVTYGDVSPGVPLRPTSGVLVSDASEDWSGHQQIPIYDSGHGDQANPSSVEIEPGLFMTLGYDVPKRTLYGIYTRIGDYRDPEMNLEVTPAADLTATTGEELADAELAQAVDAWGNPPVSLTASVDWGDGTEPAVGGVVEVDGGHVVTGSHVYDSAGTYDVTVTVADRTQQRTVTLAVDVTDPPVCPEPDERETVVIGGIDSGVPNVARGDGCTLNDRIEDEREWASHGAFVRHVVKVADRWYDDELIDERERGALVHTAGRSDVGRS